MMRKCKVPFWAEMEKLARCGRDGGERCEPCGVRKKSLTFREATSAQAVVYGYTHPLITYGLNVRKPPAP